VIGAVMEREGGTLHVRARRAVILAGGGFEHNQVMREQYLPKPTDRSWSAGAHSNTGDVLKAAMDLGADTKRMDGAWWCTTISVPGEELPRLSIMEKSYPGSCVVNQAGRRFANESQNYMSYQKELFRVHSEENPCVPSYMIFDRRFRAKYVVGPLLTSGMRPDWILPRRFFGKLLFKDSTVEGLAKKAGINPQGLSDTIERFNEFARTGKDLDFQRGDTAYDRYYADPEGKPNPCLAPIAKPPFYAMRIDPGDFGTHGGLLIDSFARVQKDGKPIEGLYATGNCTTALLPNYPGPGATLGPAMTFAYQAAKHITGHQEAQS